MTHRARTIRQRQLFEPNGPNHVLEGDRKTELLALRNLSTTLRHWRLRFTEQSLLLWMWMWQVG